MLDPRFVRCVPTQLWLGAAALDPRFVRRVPTPALAVALIRLVVDLSWCLTPAPCGVCRPQLCQLWRLTPALCGACRPQLARAEFSRFENFCTEHLLHTKTAASTRRGGSGTELWRLTPASRGACRPQLRYEAAALDPRLERRVPTPASAAVLTRLVVGVAVLDPRLSRSVPTPTLHMSAFEFVFFWRVLDIVVLCLVFACGTELRSLTPAWRGVCRPQLVLALVIA